MPMARRAFKPSTAEQRKRLRAHFDATMRIHEAWRAAGCPHPPPETTLFPDELRDLCCGAKTRKGTSCRNIALYLNGRCRFHGGLSTGPRTEEGKRKSALNGFRSARTP